MDAHKKTDGEASELKIWQFSTGNIANNLMFMMVAMYVMYYYTNILGLSAAVAGSIFMIARLIDAATDPLMGMIVDRSNFKNFGKYRGYIVFGAPLLGISFFLLFTTPNLSPSGKLAYAYITYIMYSLTWTVVQIPQLALPIILSKNVARRTRIQAIFQGLGSVAVMVVQSWALPMLKHFGGLDNPAAWTKVVLIYAVAATVIFIFSAMSVNKLDVYKPKAENADKKHSMTMKQSLKAIFSNRALLCIMLAYATDMFATQISNSLRIYFFKYNMDGKTNLIVYLGYIGLVASFLMMFLVQPFVKKFGKRVGITIIESISILFALLLLLAAPTKNVALVMLSYGGTIFLFTITNLLSRAAVLDSANYAEMQTGVANNALVSSTFTFINKVAQAFSAFFAGSILTMTGYNAQAAQQSQGTLNAILYLMTIVPIVAYIFSLIGMYFYPLTRQGEIDMEAKLSELHLQKATAADIRID